MIVLPSLEYIIITLQMVVKLFFNTVDSLILYSYRFNEDLSYYSEIQKSDIFFFSWRDPEVNSFFNSYLNPCLKASLIFIL